MKIAVFSTKPYDREFLDGASARHDHELHHLEPRLTPETAALADGYDAVCAFVNDDLSETVLTRLAEGGIRVIALRSAGFNHVDAQARSGRSSAAMVKNAWCPVTSTLGEGQQPGEHVVEALEHIAETTLANVTALETGVGEAHGVPMPT